MPVGAIRIGGHGERTGGQGESITTGRVPEAYCLLVEINGVGDVVPNTGGEVGVPFGLSVNLPAKGAVSS